MTDNTAYQQLVANLLKMADEHRVHMSGLSFEETLTFKKTIFDRNDVVFGFYFELDSIGSVVVKRVVPLKGDARFRAALGSDPPVTLKISAVPCTREEAEAAERQVKLERELG